MAPRRTDTAAVVDVDAIVESTENNALTIASPRALAVTAPATGRGKEELNDKDVYAARLTLAQSTSPQTKKREESYIEGLDEGMFFNSVTGDIYGPGPIVFAIIKITKRAGIFDEAGKMTERGLAWDDPRCESPGEDAQGKWIKPEATRIYDILLMRIEDGKPAGLLAMSGKKTAFKHAKRLNSIVLQTPGDMWDVLYKVEAKPESNGKFNYFIPKFSYFSNKAAERKTPLDLAGLCEGIYESFVRGRVTVADDTAAEPADDQVPF